MPCSVASALPATNASERLRPKSAWPIWAVRVYIDLDLAGESGMSSTTPDTPADSLREVVEGFGAMTKTSTPYTEITIKARGAGATVSESQTCIVSNGNTNADKVLPAYSCLSLVSSVRAFRAWARLRPYHDGSSVRLDRTTGASSPYFFATERTNPGNHGTAYGLTTISCISWLRSTLQ